MERPLFKLVDAVEVMNSKVTEKENRFAAEVATGLDLPATGGSDAHEVSEVGVYATQFSDPIKDEKDLIEEALRGRNYSPIAFREERSKRSRAHGSST
jgi:predicted metal-dependent phosphoesterase TrpH